MKENLVSVVMPVYNCETHIKEAILSVLSQTYTQFELLICDNGSNDKTISIINSYLKDSRVKLFYCQKKGVSYARNKCLEQANGRYIAFLDSDDCWEPSKLQIQLQFMKKNNVVFCYSEYDYIDSDSKQSNTKKRNINEVTTYKALLKNNYIGTLTVVLDKKIIGPVLFSNIKHEDLVLWLLLLKKGIVAKGIKQILASYRITSQSLTANKFKAATWRYQIYRKAEGFTVLKSLYYFLFYAYNSVIRKKC
ncbi:MAG: glycosyltransferase family 2 protein [Clostridiales bacterium]|nr:glycosyltransferase family 2 protein [Clostridiales bacterium]